MAARGLHIAGVEHVINYDFPLNVQVRGARHEQVPHTARVARRARVTPRISISPPSHRVAAKCARALHFNPSHPM